MYAKFVKRGLKEPDSVLHYTMDYQRRSDVFLDYIEENLEETENEGDVITFSAMYNHFKQWHIRYFNSKPNKIYSKNIWKRFGKCIKRPERWKKLKFQSY